jgi:3-oxoacyl-[acyl-carrier protein] reductase
VPRALSSAPARRAPFNTIIPVNAIVTGASRGIGRGIARELAQTHRVIGTYLGSREHAETLKSETGCEIFRCDISKPDDRAALIAHARELFPDGLDLLVNNAGIAPRERRDVLDATEESFDELIATNLKGPHFLTQLAARWMSEPRCISQHGRGRIVFVSSISAFTASVNRAEYCVSKAGLSMSRMVYAQRLVPQARMGEPRDIAQVVRAIANGYLDYCAGQIIHADGGFHLRSL